MPAALPRAPADPAAWSTSPRPTACCRRCSAGCSPATRTARTTCEPRWRQPGWSSRTWSGSRGCRSRWPTSASGWPTRWTARWCSRRPAPCSASRAAGPQPAPARRRPGARRRSQPGQQVLEVVGDSAGSTSAAKWPPGRSSGPSSTGQPRCRRAGRAPSYAGERRSSPHGASGQSGAHRQRLGEEVRARAAAATRPAQPGPRRPAPARAGRRRSSREGAAGGEHRRRARPRRPAPRPAAGPAGWSAAPAAARRPGRRTPRPGPGRPPGRAEQRQQVARPGVADQQDRAGPPPAARTCSAAPRDEPRGVRRRVVVVHLHDDHLVAPRRAARPAAAPGLRAGERAVHQHQHGRVAASSVMAPGCPRLGDRGHPSRPAAPDHRQGRRARPGGALLRPRGRLLRRPAPDHAGRRGGTAGRRR